jgi:hypothetical protein
MSKRKTAQKISTTINQNDDYCERCRKKYIMSDEQKIECEKDFNDRLEFLNWYNRSYGEDKVKKGVKQCETCSKLFCTDCYKIHDKYNECFVYDKTKCDDCGSNYGSYDFGVRKVLCGYCI